MKRVIPVLTFLGASLVALTTLAQPPDDRSEKADRPRGPEMRERLLKEFDKDGDGKLSEEERETAREAMRERFRRWRDEAGPRDDDAKGKKGGRRPDGERRRHGPEGGPPNPDALFDRFDEDDNDALSRDEFKKLADFVRHHRHGPPGGPPGPPPRGPRFDFRGPDGPPPRDGGEFRRRRRPDGPPGPGGPPGPPPRDESRGDDPAPPADGPADADPDEAI
jgi:hypothetical protein